jgi:hypothetical protein
VDRQDLIAHFEVLLPMAARWAAEQETRIMREGVPLSGQEIFDAAAAGVRKAERVRLLQVELVPRPIEPVLAAACDAINFLTPATRGLTLGYGIFVRSDCWRERALIAHELVHTAQYERMGDIEIFLRQYLMECLTVGYFESPLELEAVGVSARIVGD